MHPTERMGGERPHVTQDRVIHKPILKKNIEQK